MLRFLEFEVPFQNRQNQREKSVFALQACPLQRRLLFLSCRDQVAHGDGVPLAGWVWQSWFCESKASVSRQLAVPTAADGKNIRNNMLENSWCVSHEQIPAQTIAETLQQIALYHSSLYYQMQACRHFLQILTLYNTLIWVEGQTGRSTLCWYSMGLQVTGLWFMQKAI